MGYRQIAVSSEVLRAAISALCGAERALFRGTDSIERESECGLEAEVGGVIQALRAALTTPDRQVSAARAEALEEAARVCERLAGSDRDQVAGYLSQAAEEIRALAQKARGA